MSRIEIFTDIYAPPGRVFDLARSIDLHVATQTRHKERAVAGTTRGLIGPGESVTWEAVHFGFRQRLTSRLAPEFYDRPRRFRDSMVPGSGVFAGFDHDHIFETVPMIDGDGVAENEVSLAAMTRMIDVFDFRAPLGFAGRLVERIYLDRYMRGLLVERGAIIKRVAESDEWRDYLPA
ncbi:MAG: cell division protein [bacterium]|nr:cell division protein [bacterium]